MELREKVIWTAVAVMGAVALGIVALTRGEPVNAAWLVTAAVCIYFIAYRFYALVHRPDRARRRSEARHAGLPPQRRARLRSDQSLRAVRPPFRGDRRGGPAGRAGAGGADGLPARHAVDSGGRRVRRRGAGHGRAVLLDPPRRQVARRDDPHRNRVGCGQRRRRRHHPDLRHPAGGARARRRQRAEGEPVGDLRGREHHSDRAVHGPLQPLHPPRAGSARCRRSAPCCCCWRSSTARRSPRRRRSPPCSTSPARNWRCMVIGYGFVASVLPVWLLLAPRDYLSTFLKVGTILLLAIGILIVRPNLEMPAVTQFIDGSGPVWAGEPVPVPVHHHRLRRGQRLALADLVRHDAEDDRERGPDPLHRLRRDADGILRRDHGDGRGDDHPSGRLFRDEQRRRPDRDRPRARGRRSSPAGASR